MLFELSPCAWCTKIETAAELCCKSPTGRPNNTKMSLQPAEIGMVVAVVATALHVPAKVASLDHASCATCEWRWLSFCIMKHLRLTSRHGPVYSSKMVTIHQQGACSNPAALKDLQLSLIWAAPVMTRDLKNGQTNSKPPPSLGSGLPGFHASCICFIPSAAHDGWLWGQIRNSETLWAAD